MNVRETYEARLAARKSVVTTLRGRESTISIARLIAIVMAIAIAFWSVRLAIVPAVVFLALVIAHERLVRRRQAAESGAVFYERGMARLDDRWQGKGDHGSDFVEEHHPYAADLDLFGKGSLFELISLAGTRAGRSRLAFLLKNPSLEAREIHSRQEAVAELRETLDLREDLAIAVAALAKEIEEARLDAWAAAPLVTVSRFERIAARGLPVITIILLLASLPALVARVIGWTHPEAVLRIGIFAEVPAWPLVIAIIVALSLARRLEGRVAAIVSAVERAEPALARLAAITYRLEKERFISPHLVLLHSRFHATNVAASAEIERLRRLVALLEAPRNQFFAPFAAVLLWTPNVALAIERWRNRSGAHVVAWIESIGEIEALSSLGSFAFEHPAFVMPEIVDRAPLFDARGIGHPLIPAQRRVTNDLFLDETLHLLVISGSNMSGKSTMMRSAGLAAVLASAGGVVCATSLRLSPTAIGASISIHDSLQENASRFYAEILRIRQVIDLSRQGPLLFLLDEILAGTNSHDRRIGAEAIVKGLVGRGAIGMVSTHDLALAEIAVGLGERASNVHFEDRIEDGRVVFDYRMRPGVVTRSNALELMRSVGIEI